MTTAETAESTETAVPAPANFRDLGGVPVEGGRVRPGLLFRSDDVATAPADFVADVCSRHGIGHVLDLRSADEAARTGRGPFADPAVTGGDVAYHHLPFAVDASPEAWKESLPATAREVAALYADTADRSAPAIAFLLSLIASADRPAVFHCAAGKDRTGILAAFVLTALGAGAEDVADDYARTDAVMPEVGRRIRHSIDSGSVPELGPQEWERLSRSPMMGARRETMVAFLETMADRHGGDPLGGLRAAGLDGAVVGCLRARLTAG
ncbi:tyrosine-protein phosphatase [Nocardiopsis sp. LOL_012]|uniref:tyrosine-protein phosphatase n=1 Tax=Nocardiopsis sp. LOL_012 TaxID=3345409 RepID=UPI003A845ECC